MWKALVGFLLFAAVALFFIFKAGDKMDMAGEAGAHLGSESASASASATTAPATAASVPAPEVSASAASAPTSQPAATATPVAASK